MEEVMGDISMADTDMPMPMPMPMQMTMPMSFWKGPNLTWLIYNVDSTNAGQYTGGLIVTFFLAIFVELLIYMRNLIYAKAQIAAIEKTCKLNR